MSAYRVRTAITPIMSAPSFDAVCTSEALHGETLLQLEEFEDWLLVKQVHDDYEGYVYRKDLTALSEWSVTFAGNTHWVSQRSTLVFQKPDLKSPVLMRLPFASELQLRSLPDSAFSQTQDEGFIWTDHCLPLNEVHPSAPLKLAQSHFLGMPYRWGGRSPEGADCSGLIQLLARSQGIRLPRDSGDQEQYLETTIAPEEYRACDIVYWPGHTGILLDANTLLHSTAYSLSCVIEPLNDVINRAGQVSSVKRLFV